MISHIMRVTQIADSDASWKYASERTPYWKERFSCCKMEREMELMRREREIAAAGSNQDAHNVASA